MSLHCLGTDLGEDVFSNAIYSPVAFTSSHLLTLVKELGIKGGNWQIFPNAIEKLPLGACRLPEFVVAMRADCLLPAPSASRSKVRGHSFLGHSSYFSPPFSTTSSLYVDVYPLKSVIIWWCLDCAVLTASTSNLALAKIQELAAHCTVPAHLGALFLSSKREFPTKKILCCYFCVRKFWPLRFVLYYGMVLLVAGLRSWVWNCFM